MHFKKISFLFFLLGFVLLIWIIIPILNFILWEMTASQDLISPYGSQIFGQATTNQDDPKSFLPYEEFSITISKLNLENIKVKVNSLDFKSSLAHLPNSALPGDKGNVFITGHSSLPFLDSFNEKKAYFSNLYKLKQDDLIFITAAGSKFNYQVINVYVVDPQDSFIINPPDQLGRYLTLMTCVPPGLDTKRLVVLGELR